MKMKIISGLFIIFLVGLLIELQLDMSARIRENQKLQQSKNAAPFMIKYDSGHYYSDTRPEINEKGCEFIEKFSGNKIFIRGNFLISERNHDRKFTH